MNKRSIFYLFFLLVSLILSDQLNAQIDTIRLNNPSFEDNPRRGGESQIGIKGWYDCGRMNFPAESPPDIHPNGYWKNDLPASDGKTYLGIVVRDNNTYESVSQRLDSTLRADKCYSFSINLARAENYWSPTKLDLNTTANYVTPAVLRIWGGSGFCNEQELLAESTPVSNSSWQIYKFEFRPKSNIRYITLEAFYKTPVLFPYNGNLLVDGASDIIQIACPGEPPLIAKADNSKLPPHKRKKQPTAENAKSMDSAPLPSPNVRKVKMLPELSITTIKEGQTIEIKNLYFKADTSTINKESYEVLDELYEFLVYNRDVIIEIGGHTNGVPDDAYCDRLSTARAKAVAEYLIRKGIDPSKVQFKGYGKKKPIASDKTALGRTKNQRVEIKILSLSKAK